MGSWEKYICSSYVPASCKSQLVASEKFRKKELFMQGMLSKNFCQENENFLTKKSRF